MSRTIRNRTQSNELNSYAYYKLNYYMERGANRGLTQSESIDDFLVFYRRDGYCMGAPKRVRQSFNRSQKQRFKQNIHHGLKNDSFDNLVTMVWLKEANWHYW